MFGPVYEPVTILKDLYVCCKLVMFYMTEYAAIYIKRAVSLSWFLVFHDEAHCSCFNRILKALLNELVDKSMEKKSPKLMLRR